MFQKRCMDTEMGMNMNQGMNMNMGMESAPLQLDGVECPVVYECPIERVCHREIHHHIPHV